jgi:pimeloyl-ACP methyl ester carboxylesterase
MDDLVSTVISTLHEPADLVAQSMGGVVALRVALAAPHYVRRLVLAATSGGIPISDREGTDWRSDYRREFPLAAPWITDIHEDLSPQLAGVTAPCLLLWGGADPISPPSVGRRLLELLPDARLHIVDGGRHDLAQTHASEIAPLIAAHLR